MENTRDLNSIKTLLEKLTQTNKHNSYDFLSFYDAIDLLDTWLMLIRDCNENCSESSIKVLKEIHYLVIKMTLRVIPKNVNPTIHKMIDTTRDLAYLVNKYKLKPIFDKTIDSDVANTVDFILSDSFKDHTESIVGFDEFREQLAALEKNEKLFQKAKERFSESLDVEWKDIAPFFFVSPLSKVDTASCLFYIEELGETADDHIKELLPLFKQQGIKIDKITKALEKLSKIQNQKTKKPDKLVSPNNNPSRKVFGNSNSKLKENETPYFSVTYTQEELLEYRSLISTNFARDITVKDTKTLTGQLALMSSVDRSIQQERVKPMLSAPLSNFDRYVYSNTVACLRNYINKKVEVDMLLTSFSGTDRIREETDFTRSFVNSLTKMRSTSVFFEYRTKTKIVSILEPLLSFTLKKEIDAKTGKEKNYIILHKMPEFFEWAESLKQVISIPEKLFRVEYKKNGEDGKISRLRQTKRNTLLLNHLLEHISNFRYYFENKKQKDSEEEDSPERFSKILFETLCEVTETKTKDEKRELPFTIEHCFEYWKKCNLVDYKFEWEAATGGRRLVAIHLFYPEDPHLKLT